MDGLCKMPGKETCFTFDQFDAGECGDCENRRVCRFTKYCGDMYGPFNCAGESIAEVS